ncbi:MAG: restriction endonuclease, partial [Deltaproteobacteria bacterium]
MAIPNYQACMLPVLKLLADGKQLHRREIYSTLADQFKLTPEERQKKSPNNPTLVMDSRVGWATSYLKLAGLLSQPQRGYYQITQAGNDLLQTNLSSEAVARKVIPTVVNLWKQRSLKSKNTSQDTENYTDAEKSLTPDDAIENGFQELNLSLTNDINEKLKECTPAFFERLVVELLVTMGYGGSLQEAGSVVGKSGDGGIDGIIKEDKLGLDAIYIQAKKWEGTVGRPEIQKFVGALAGKKAKKGVFITTSSFSKDAIDYATNIEHKVVLIDGDLLAELMIE